MKVNETVGKSKVDEIVLTITEKGDAREVKDGIKVCDCKAKDETGEIVLSLWSDDIEKYEVGQTVKVTDGWCNEFMGIKSVSSGRFGKIEVVENE